MNSVNEKRIEGMNAWTICFLRDGLFIKGSAKEYKEVDMLFKRRDISDDVKDRLSKKWNDDFWHFISVVGLSAYLGCEVYTMAHPYGKRYVLDPVLIEESWVGLRDHVRKSSNKWIAIYTSEDEYKVVDKDKLVKMPLAEILERANKKQDAHRLIINKDTDNVKAGPCKLGIMLDVMNGER